MLWAVISGHYLFIQDLHCQSTDYTEFVCNLRKRHNYCILILFLYIKKHLKGITPYI